MWMSVTSGTSTTRSATALGRNRTHLARTAPGGEPMPNTGAPPGGPDDRSAARANAVILNRSSPLSLFLMDTLVVEAGLVALLAFRGVAALPVLATCIVSSDAVVLFQSLLLGNRSPAMRTKRGRSVSTTGTKSFHFAIRWWRSLVMMSFIGWAGSQN